MNIFVSVFLLLALHYLYFLLRIFFGLSKNGDEKNDVLPEDFISVIIPFRNEQENILNNLRSLEAQNYPDEKFEVIYVDDFSTDTSKSILENALNKSNVKVLSVPRSHSDKAHKKRAIEFGFQNSAGNIIVSTDADCIVPENWLIKILSGFDEKTAFVSGPVDFIEEKSIFQKYQKLEFRSLIIVGAGLIGAGRPTLCNAANLAYRKNVFEEVKGHSSNLNISSGDDEFLMQKIAFDTEYKIKFAADPEAVVLTPANSSLNKFYNQRKRWASKGLFYQNKNLIFQLILIYLFYLSLLAGLTLGILFDQTLLMISALIFGLKIIVEFFVLRRGCRKFYMNCSLKLFIPSQLLHLIYIVFFGAAGVFGNYEWKGRRVKR